MIPPIADVVPLVHLVVLALWGGVVATEAVVEVMPFRRRELHAPAIRLHYWIDLLVELPLVILVVVTGGMLLYVTEEITRLHLVKVGFAGAAVMVNLFCIGVVLQRARWLDAGEDAATWRASRVVLACFVCGLAFAAVAAPLGFKLALQRLG